LSKDKHNSNLNSTTKPIVALSLSRRTSDAENSISFNSLKSRSKKKRSVIKQFSAWQVTAR
jgi:hypothetical protein